MRTILGEIILPDNKNQTVFSDNQQFIPVVLPVLEFWEDATTLTDESDLGGAQWEDLYETPIAPNTFNLDGNEIKANYHGIFAANTNDKELRISFGGVTFGEVLSQQSGMGWDYSITVMRSGVDSVRWSATLVGQANAISVGEITMLDFNDPFILSLQGRTENADGDLTAKKGKVLFVPASLPDIEPPSAPVIVDFIADSDTELTLSWNASTDNVGVTGYEVQIRLASGSYGAPADVGNVLDEQFTGLTAEIEYRAQARAYDAAGNFSAWSNEASATTDAAPPPIPSDIADLLIWARNGTGLFQDSAKTTPATGTDPVGAWADSSGNGRDLLQATSGLRPVLNSGAVDFNGSDNELVTSGTFTLKPATLFVLVNFDSLSGNRRIWGVGIAGGLGIDTNNTDLRLLKTNVALIGTSTTAMSTGSWFRLIVTYDGSGNYEFFVNGASAGTGTNNQTIDAFNIVMGGQGVYLDGLVKDAGAYSRVLNSGEIAAVDAYLATL